MRWTSVVCLCMLAVQLASTYPLEDSKSTKLETISTLEESIGKPTSEHSDREKRTIGFLRTLFPQLSKIIDDKIQQLTSVIFRIVGRFVLRGGGLGGGGGGNNENGGEGGSRRISITLPTYPPDEDEDETDAPDETSSPEPSTEGNDIAQEKVEDGVGAQKRSAPSNTEKTAQPVASGNSSSGSRGQGVASKCTPAAWMSNALDLHEPDGKSEETSRRRREAPADLETDETENKEVRVPIVPDNNKVSDKEEVDEDVEGAESENEEVSNDADETESAGESGTRSKRLGVLGSLFGGGGRDSGSSAGSGGGSGNFLFDIIRRSADGAARAAGTVYRMIAGTETETVAPNSDETNSESNELGRLKLETAAATSPTVSTPAGASKPPLVAGSGATEQQDENANAPIAPGTDGASAVSSDDGYQAGIPGPITRLFVIANRGIANLIQDLILRLAQTSERIVNFKARLITAII